MTTTSEFGNADVVEDTYAKVKSTLSKVDGMIVPVVTGFIGHDRYSYVLLELLGVLVMTVNPSI